MVPGRPKSALALPATATARLLLRMPSLPSYVPSCLGGGRRPLYRKRGRGPLCREGAQGLFARETVMGFSEGERVPEPPASMIGMHPAV
eukprot:319552-Chlamydomonas_euryale.AAC.1